MPRDLRSPNPSPLSESEEFQLKRLLDRRAQSLPEAQAARDKERAQERRLQEKRDKLAAEKSRLAKRLAQLHVDLDVASAEIYKLSPSGTAFRFVNERLQQLGDIVPKQSFFNTRFDTLDQKQLLLLGEIALSLFEANARPKGGKPLRERMENIKVDIGPGGPDGPGDPSDDRAAMARAILEAGRKARGGKL